MTDDLKHAMVVTSWGEADASTLGARWAETYAQHWGTLGEPLVYTDFFLDTASDYPKFLARHKDRPMYSGSMRWGAAKWARKVFALREAIREVKGETRWLLWVDADVEFTAPPDEKFWRHVTPEDAAVSFLARPWAYASETGFVAYRMDSPGEDIIRKMADTYVTGRVFQQENWGDGFTFDRVRESMNWSNSKHGQNNLTPEGCAEDFEQNGLHVWPKSVLADYMRHNKGPKRKEKAYGAAEPSGWTPEVTLDRAMASQAEDMDERLS